MNKITIQICTKDRHSEVSLLLQSLRTQTYKDWDLILLDDGSGNPINNCHFIGSILNRIKLEGHKVKTLRNNISQGVCSARNKLIKEDKYNNAYVCRLDDDCIIEPDYLERLVSVIESGYDIATGVIPLLAYPTITRDTNKIDNTICLHAFDSEGNLIIREDELAYQYLNKKKTVFNCHQFRTNALYKKEVTYKVKYPETLTKTGFREELWFSFQAILQGFKIGADTQAVAYHLATPSGGTRAEGVYSENVALDEETTNKQIKKWFKKNGDFLK